MREQLHLRAWTAPPLDRSNRRCPIVSRTITSTCCRPFFSPSRTCTRRGCSRGTSASHLRSGATCSPFMSAIRQSEPAASSRRSQQHRCRPQEESCSSSTSLTYSSLSWTRPVSRPARPTACERRSRGCPSDTPSSRRCGRWAAWHSTIFVTSRYSPPRRSSSSDPIRRPTRVASLVIRQHETRTTTSSVSLKMTLSTPLATSAATGNVTTTTTAAHRALEFQSAPIAASAAIRPMTAGRKVEARRDSSPGESRRTPPAP